MTTGTLSKVFNDAKRELEALKDLESLKDFFKENDGKMFSKRITDKLPKNIHVKLNQEFIDPRLEIRIYLITDGHYNYSNSFEFTIYHTGYGEDLGIHPLDGNKRINAENIATIIDHVIAYTKKSKAEILETDLEALSKALKVLYDAENVMKEFNYTLLADGLGFWPDSYKTTKAIRNLNEYLTGEWTLEGVSKP